MKNTSRNWKSSTAAIIMAASILLPTAAQAAQKVTIDAAKPVTPPVSQHQEMGVQKLVPFKVWVEPSTGEGTQIAGHYEYFDMYMNSGEAVMVIDGAESAPAVKAVVTEVMGQPAIQ